MKAKNIIPFLFLMVVCRENNEFNKLKEGDFAIVVRGTYRGRPIYLGPDNKKYEDLINQLCSKIDKHHDVLPMITRKFFFVPEKLVYKFKFATLDKEKKRLILRYFARVVSHPVWAGYQIQFVFDTTTKKLVQIFTAEVPLE